MGYLVKDLSVVSNLEEYTKLQKELLELSNRFIEAGKKRR